MFPHVSPPSPWIPMQIRRRLVPFRLHVHGGCHHRAVTREVWKSPTKNGWLMDGYWSKPWCQLDDMDDMDDMDGYSPSHMVILCKSIGFDPSPYTYHGPQRSF